MPKPDFPALLPPGVHSQTLAAIEALAVSPFPGDPRRALLFSQFSNWIKEIQAANVTARIWIDGSFLTEKPSPDDIDCIVWAPKFTVAPSSADILTAQKLLDKPAARALFNLDLYHEQPAPNEVLHREAYWMGFLGFCHDRVTAKGFAELLI